MVGRQTHARARCEVHRALPRGAPLKEPEQFLPVQECGGSFERGVCAGHIERLGKVAQSTMSNHLSVLQQAGLIQVEKYGQWSYFTRNEALIQQYIEHLKQTL